MFSICDVIKQSAWVWCPDQMCLIVSHLLNYWTFIEQICLTNNSNFSDRETKIII